jgi:hypothetical protein
MFILQETEVPDKLYLNQGNMTFKDITASANLNSNTGWKNGVSLVDINNDGIPGYLCL